MATIVEYRDDKPPRNLYPDRIISPRRPSPCCAEHMALIGEPSVELRGQIQYKRCTECGYTVRAILTSLADPAVLKSARRGFAKASSW